MNETKPNIFEKWKYLCVGPTVSAHDRLIFDLFDTVSTILRVTKQIRKKNNSVKYRTKNLIRFCIFYRCAINPTHRPLCCVRFSALSAASDRRCTLRSDHQRRPRIGCCAVSSAASERTHRRLTTPLLLLLLLSPSNREGCRRRPPKPVRWWASRWPTALLACHADRADWRCRWWRNRRSHRQSCCRPSIGWHPRFGVWFCRRAAHRPPSRQRPATFGRASVRAAIRFPLGWCEMGGRGGNELWKFG